MATICLYETPGKNWFGAGGMYEVICEYALAHPSVQALPEFARAIEDSLWHRNLELYEHGDAAIKAFTEGVGDLVRYIDSPEGRAVGVSITRSFWNGFRCSTICSSTTIPSGTGEAFWRGVAYHHLLSSVSD